MNCVSCGQYFKPTAFTNQGMCDDCDGVVDNYDMIDEELGVELSLLTNPSGRVRAQIVDDRE